MKKFIFIFLWLGIVSNAFAMKRVHDEVTLEFPSKTACYEKIEKFIQLPYASIEKIFSNPNFTLETENSAFALLMAWAYAQDQEAIKALILKAEIEFADKDERENFIKDGRRPILAEHVRSILDLINLNMITDGYFLYQVSKIVDYLQLPDLIVAYNSESENRPRNTLDISRNLAREITNQREDPVESERITVRIPVQETFTIRLVCRDLTSWKEGERLYSEKIFSNGYTFCLVARLEKDQDGEYLAVRIHCMASGMPKFLNEPINLPVKLEFKLSVKDLNYVQPEPMEVIFHHLNRSFGRSMSGTGDNWGTIRNGTSPLVVDGKITVYVTVTVLDL